MFKGLTGERVVWKTYNRVKSDFDVGADKLAYCRKHAKYILSKLGIFKLLLNYLSFTDWTHQGE